ncbi:RICIN domain-containing protein [Streptomyces noursei]|uniref:RICIN domain-containing protein n=1 Tax=Streptomyces noursei TaxID=1971 RepID=UPI0023B86ED2|nr:ricin-type beta-trefoil lectin domain protein [Streptomyces noursei]
MRSPLPVLAATAAALALAVASTVPADAAPARYVIVKNSEGKCLDSDKRGDVYMHKCIKGNTYQLWQWAPLGEGYVILYDVETRRCLDTKNRDERLGDIFTTSCESQKHTRSEHWRPVTRKGETLFWNRKTHRCLENGWRQTHVYTMWNCHQPWKVVNAK